MAASGGIDAMELRIQNLERQNKKLLKALEGFQKLLADALKPTVSPAQRKNRWNPILNKIKAGQLISAQEYQIVADFLDYDVYEYNQTLNNAIIVAFKGLINVHRPNDLAQLARNKTITVGEAMLHISKIATMQSVHDLAQYLGSPEFLAYLRS